MTAPDAVDRLLEELCGCDFVQQIRDDGDLIQIHHRAPDDGFDHVFETQSCPCQPGIARLDFDLYVVQHRDAELDPAIPLEERPCSSLLSQGG